MNSIHLIGRLTKAPRYSVTSNDKSRVNFTLAVLVDEVVHLLGQDIGRLAHLQKDAEFFQHRRHHFEIPGPGGVFGRG